MTSQISLCFVAACALLMCCNAIPMQKRDAEQQSIASDVNQHFDKILDDVNKGLKQLASDGINFQDIFSNISAKANQFGEQLQTLGKELGEKVQETAKQQGLTK